MSVKLPIYLDNHATTPCDPRVVEAMLPYFTELFGNAGSRNHSFGWAGSEGIERAREQVAAAIGADPKEIIFTSGATESDNLAVLGVAHFYKDKGKHIVTSTLEHKAILDACHALEREGYEITYLGCDKEGLVDPEAVRAALRDDTVLCTIMWANNEIGVVQDITKIGEICREKGVFFHTDAVQGVGKLPFDVVFLLNRYFAEMGRAIEESGGRVDKFIGDGIMALFGIDSTPEAGARSALAAAKRMGESLAALNRALAADLDEPLRIGLGIHLGPAIVGEMGYARATTVTAIGDAVNTASRLESLTKEFGTELVVSEALERAAAVDLSRFARQEIEIRGRSGMLAVRAVPLLADLP